MADRWTWVKGRLRAWWWSDPVRRIRRGVRLYVRFVDVLDGFGNLLILAIAVNNLSTFPAFSHQAGGAYVVILITRYVLILRNRRARDHTERKIICQLFKAFYSQIFADVPGRRITLFVVDVLDPAFVVPKVRYELGQVHHYAERISKARYRRGEGHTGRAWSNVGELIFEPLGPFPNRDAFTRFYVDTLHIDPQTVAGLSDYMVKVQGIYSAGLEDHEGHLLGILSIDLQDPSDDTDRPPADRIVPLLGALKEVLEAFSYERRRP